MKTKPTKHATDEDFCSVVEKLIQRDREIDRLIEESRALQAEARRLIARAENLLGRTPTPES